MKVIKKPINKHIFPILVGIVIVGIGQILYVNHIISLNFYCAIGMFEFFVWCMLESRISYKGNHPSEAKGLFLVGICAFFLTFIWYLNW